LSEVGKGSGTWIADDMKDVVSRLIAILTDEFTNLIPDWKPRGGHNESSEERR
jgi:hypothetical protein